MSEFFVPKVSVQSQIRAMRTAIADHKDPKAARARLSNLSWSAHKLEEQHLTAALETLLRIEAEDRAK